MGEVRDNPIALHRKAVGLTQRELAIKLDCAITTIHLYEKGSFKPSADRIMKLAKIFGISFDELAKELNIGE